MESKTLLVIVFVLSFLYLYIRNRTYLRENFRARRAQQQKRSVGTSYTPSVALPTSLSPTMSLPTTGSPSFMLPSTGLPSAPTNLTSLPSRF